ncbi:MAG TPA: RNA polymerase sigma factor [Thermoanaerobaculia bacterium]|nr:RNA polymerase sigma factor [Thermoanaerobaculia bacterium]
MIDEQFEVLYRKYYARVFRHFRSMRFADDLAHDLAQDTFKRIYEHISSSAEGELSWSFVETVAQRLALNRVRALKTQKRAGDTQSLESLSESPEISSNPFTGEELSSREMNLIVEEEERILQEQVKDAISSLPSRQRECLRLWIEGFAYDEIASVLNLSLDAVKSRLRDAKRTLRERLRMFA